MKRSSVILWIVAALFLVSSAPLFTQGNAAAGVCGIVIAAVLFFVGFRKNKAADAKEENAPEASKPEYKVYVEKGGERYHDNMKCSGMKNPQYIPLKTALKKGYTSCGKCCATK